MRVRAVRGATQLEEDSVDEMRLAVVDLLTTLFQENEISTDDLVSILFTATPDIHSDFPAAAARTLDLGSIPLICAQEIDVAGALPRVVRVLVHAYSNRSHGEIKHIYRRGAAALRKDIAQ
jgi:chorismate mutase